MLDEIKKAHGGARRGAGRKMSEERKAVIAASEEARARALAAMNGESPLDYMLRVMRDATADQRRRDAMAIAAASFVHPKLAAVQHSGDPENPVETVTRIELTAPRHGDRSA